MQKPNIVLEEVNRFYRDSNANPSRGFYDLSIVAQEKLEQSRQVVAEFIHAKSKDEIIFTKNATESLNLLALSLGQFFSSDDEILVSIGEHHSNLLPWLHLKTVKTKVIPCNEFGVVSPEILKQNITDNTKAIVFTAMSNVTGSSPDFSQILEITKKHNLLTILDATQFIAHHELNASLFDFVAFSGHKIGAFMGIGVLYGKKSLFKSIPPAFLGGGMIEHIEIATKTFKYKSLPTKFEAGTINIGGAISLSTAIQYWQNLGLKNIQDYLLELTNYLEQSIANIPGMQVLFLENGIFTFNLENLHPHDVVSLLNQENIAVRAGFHCAKPLLNSLNIGPCVRASLSFYNTKSEIDYFVKALKKIASIS